MFRNNKSTDSILIITVFEGRYYMLNVTLRVDEGIQINNNFTLQIVSMGRNKAEVSICVPKHVKVRRIKWSQI